MKKRNFKTAFEDKEHFEIAFEAVAWGLVYTSVYFDLFKRLDGAFEEYNHEISQALAFWNITRDLHLSATIIGLCRAYDTHPKSNNLPLILSTISTATTTEDENNIIEPSCLAKLDAEQLAADIRFVNARNEPVKKLLAWRGSMFAHSNFEMSTGRNEFPKLLKPHVHDFELLLTKGIEIANRYGNILYSKQFGTSLTGIDAYSFVFECIRKGLSAYELERNESLKNYGVNPEVFNRGGFDRK